MLKNVCCLFTCRYNSDHLDLGPCCYCERTEGVQTILMLDLGAPLPGTGWGCARCDLPEDGALAVLCTVCTITERRPRFAIAGPLGSASRAPIATLHDVFQHNPIRHVNEFVHGHLKGDPIVKAIADVLAQQHPALFQTLKRLIDLNQTKRQILRHIPDPARDTLTESMIHVTIDYLLTEKFGRA